MIHRIKHNSVLLAVMMLLSACSREPQPAVEISAVLTVRIEGMEEGQTKTSYDSGNGLFAWSAGDRIAVHYSDGAYASLPVNAGTNAVDAPSTTQRYRDYYAVYPASAADPSGYGNPTLRVTLPSAYDISGAADTDYSPCPMVAANEASTDILDFRHVGGLLRLTLPAATVPAATRTVRLSFDKDVTGSYTVANPTSAEPAITTACNGNNNVITFTLTGSSAGVGALSSDVVLNVPLPCGSYDSLTAELLNGSGAVLVSDNYTAPIYITRHHGKQLKLFGGSPDSQPSGALTIEPIEAGQTVITIPNPNGLIYKWSFDGGMTKFRSSSNPITIHAAQGNKVILFQDSASRLMGNSSSGISLSKPCYVYGNVMSLSSEEDFATATVVVEYQFQNLFRGCTNLRSHPTEPILLPATTLAAYCYSGMFRGCSSLTLVECHSLIIENFDNWMEGVPATGTFRKESSATWVSGPSGIPEGWTVVNM